MVFAGIVAGGMGSRFRSDIPKQFLDLKMNYNLCSWINFYEK